MQTNNIQTLGILGFSWREKVISALNNSYPSNKGKWKAILNRVYDSYVARVAAGSASYGGINDTKTTKEIQAATGDQALDIARVLSAIAAIDREKITQKHIGILTKIVRAPADALSQGARSLLDPLVPYLIPIAIVLIGGSYLYFYKSKKDVLEALTVRR